MFQGQLEIHATTRQMAALADGIQYLAALALKIVLDAKKTINLFHQLVLASLLAVLFMVIVVTVILVAVI